MKLLELTDHNGKLLLVNPHAIDAIKSHNSEFLRSGAGADYTSIILTRSRETHYVRDTIDEIRRMVDAG